MDLSSMDFRQAIEDALARGDRISDPAFFAILFAGSLLEYVFPPIPGDVLTAGAAILVARGQKFLTVLAGVMAGSAAGFLLDYAFGVWLADPRRGFRRWGPRWERLGKGIDRTAVLFDRHPALYLVLNRFLPGVRALFFVAAGFGRVPLWKVLVFGLGSACAWNLLLIAGGFAVGKNLDLLLAWVHRYTLVAWAGVALAALIIAWRWRRSRRRRQA